MTRYVHLFSDPPATQVKELLGGKGAGLAEMTRLGIPVPPGLTITTEACRAVYANGGAWPGTLRAQVLAALAVVEEGVGAKFGDTTQPLLVSVRSGARVSMPGMMDTILNVGLNDATVEALAARTNDRRFAFDAYRRFVTMYGSVVLDVERHLFEEELAKTKLALGDPSMSDHLVPVEALERLVASLKQLVLSKTGKPFPEAPHDQLWGAVAAVFESWNAKRAVTYRRMYNYPDDWGTAVSIQSMVFGNMGDDCGTGVAFTRNPSTGERLLYGEYLLNAQGEDVVAGIRTPRPIAAVSSPRGREKESLERALPEVYKQFIEVAERLEKHFRDLQDIEFTIQRGKLWLLQTRNGKRTGRAAVRVAVDMVDEGLITTDEAVLRVDPSAAEQLLHPRVPEPERLAKEGIFPLASGLPASPGAATGMIVFDADDAERTAKDGTKVVLVRGETSPEDIHGMKAAQGILTAMGGMTSHAAVVARGMGKCCVAGVSDLHVDVRAGKLVVRAHGGTAERTFVRGDILTLDGTFGKVYAGEVPVEPAVSVAGFDRLMTWVDGARRMRVRANADTPRGALDARAFGAEGIGLCRTEHMFFAAERLSAVRCVVLAGTPEVRAKWLAQIEPMQRKDFVEIFRAMAGLPVTVRLLDWPLHEFMPREPAEMAQIAAALGESVDVIKRRAEQLHEINPMLGHRGARLGLTHPDIYAAQARAIIEAACIVAAEGVDVRPEIMIPVVALAEELTRIEATVRAAAESVFTARGTRIPYLFGTMIELPRACVVADKIAASAEFFSFGTNDLTQTTLGVSRDDAGHFLPEYMSEGLRVLTRDPFATIDREGVGAMVAIACERGRSARPDIKLGICGEHGGDPHSIEFFESVGLAYISCSPFRVPIARLAAAQATLRAKKS
jgi:pyruvate,orthophosphate dikinase